MLIPVPLSCHSDGWQAQACALQAGRAELWQNADPTVFCPYVVASLRDLCRCHHVNGMSAPDPSLTPSSRCGWASGVLRNTRSQMLSRILCMLHHTPAALGGSRAVFCTLCPIVTMSTLAAMCPQHNSSVCRSLAYCGDLALSASQIRCTKSPSFVHIACDSTRNIRTGPLDSAARV